jgi:hypothetical protein
MVCIRKWRGKWVVDYRDSGGVRRWVTCRGKRHAERVVAAKIRESRQCEVTAVVPKIKVRDIAKRLLAQIFASTKLRTAVPRVRSSR